MVNSESVTAVGRSDIVLVPIDLNVLCAGSRAPGPVIEVIISSF